MEAQHHRVQASTQNTGLSYRVFSIMRHKKECDIEELVEGCGGYPWEDVLLEVARLSRTGELRIVYKQGGEYAIRLCPIKRY
jgi:hypothetical protein